MDVRDIFFRLRSYTPIPIALTIIYNSSPVIPYNVLGISFILIGELIRINAVRSVSYTHLTLPTIVGV